MFDVPVVLFLFKRKDTLVKILERIRAVKPKKMYLLADGPRNALEKEMTDEVRSHVESLIDWECEVIKKYSKTNQGVYENIGKGANWVLEQEEKAIFLEDDNLPELTFFEYCKEVLERYEADTRVLWICGTNYLESFEESNGASYFFTQHLLPCGWATWSKKFIKYYDGDLNLLTENSTKAVKQTYTDKRLYRQDIDVVMKTKRLLKEIPKLASWDRQMIFSLRVNGLYGVSPTKNQIRNIGADELSTHGGTSTNKTMTGRFCEIPTKSMSFPLVHPKYVLPDPVYEKTVGEVILFPRVDRFFLQLIRLLKPLFGVEKDESLMTKLRFLLKKHK